ncbi:outer membrane beta-barrel protein [Deminuibacter soli]|nr:outer membrane beta-barrel protein [Deminuibacter soli]
MSATVQLKAQGGKTGTIAGKLADSSSKQVLSAATISLLQAADSSLVTYVISDDKGHFSFTKVDTGAYLIQVAFQGYGLLQQPVKVTGDSMVDLGTVYLKTLENTLETVVVKSSPPLVIKKDTMEFNAGSFKTKPNAVAEDLLKKIPGITVDKSGAVTAQGETVSRILVDGKRFFGDDPKQATKNLPPDVIDKIQVFDDLSDQSKLSGFDDGNRVKTINITTKKDKRKGYFGKAVLGAGTDGTYDESMNLHRFNGTQQISLIGQVNDVNKQNFTPADMGGGGRRGGGGSITASGGGSGITTTLAAGLNYRDTWGTNTDAYGNYFYNNLKTNTSTQSHTVNQLTKDTTTTNDQDQRSVSKSQNHNINFNIETRFDSSNTLIFRPGVSFSNSTPSGSSSSMNMRTNDNTPIYSSVGNTHSQNSGYSINGASLTMMHRFKKRFRTISLNLNYSGSESKGDGYNYAVNNFYTQNRIDTINQHYFDTSRSHTFSPSLSYTEPLAKNQILELRYNYSYLSSTSVNNTYQYDDVKLGFTSFDSLFSNSFKNTTTSNRLTLTYRLQNTKYNFNIGSGVQFSDLTSINSTKGTSISNHYVNFTPSAIFTYNVSKTKNLRFFYNGSTGQPSAAQLQPIRTTSDSINFQVGNPDLKPQFTHSVRFLYHSLNPTNQRSFFATINASTIVNDIQSSIVQNSSTGSKVSTYVNLSGTYNVNGYVNWSLPLKHPKSNLNLGSNISYQQSQSLVNGESNYTRNTGLNGTIRWTTNLDNYFDMNFSSTSTYNIARNTVNTRTNANYFFQAFSAEITYFSKNGWIVASDLDYSYNGNHSPGYNASVPLWNPAIAKQFLKNHAAELRLQVFDLLNQNTAVARAVTTNTITDTRTNTLKRYFMLTFTYNLRNFAGNQNQRRMPGFFGGDRGDGNGGGNRGGWGGGNGGGGGGGRRGGGPM